MNTESRPARTIHTCLAMPAVYKRAAPMLLHVESGKSLQTASSLAAFDECVIAIVLSDLSVTRSLDGIVRQTADISQSAVGISNDLNAGPEVRRKILIEEVQLSTPESVNFTIMSRKL